MWFWREGLVPITQQESYVFWWPTKTPGHIYGWWSNGTRRSYAKESRWLKLCTAGILLPCTTGILLPTENATVSLFWICNEFWHYDGLRRGRRFWCSPTNVKFWCPPELL